MARRYIPPNAKLIAEVTADRVDRYNWDGVSMPVVGDLVSVDQAFTAPDGQTMYMVYSHRADGGTRWTADLFEAELEPLQMQGGVSI